MTLTYTKNYRFPKTDFMSEPWIQGIWDSFDAIDSLMYGQAASNGTSIWQNSYQYNLGLQVIDSVDSSTWVCVTSHTSAASPTTFAQDRAAHPTYWNAIMLSFKVRGQWLNNTAYNPGDMVYDTTAGRNIQAVCATKHVSNAAGTINDDAAYWGFTYNSLSPQTASGIGYSNAVSHLVATNVQTAIDEVVVGSNASPAMDGIATAGVLQKLSRGDHVHPTDTSRAPLNSPAFTGVPTAPTVASMIDATTKLATTAFVQNAIVNVTGGGSIPPPSGAMPLMDATPGVVGVSPSYTREDHVHPTDTSRYAASNPLGYQTAAQVTAAMPVVATVAPVMDGAAAIGASGKWADGAHIHPSDTSRVSKAGDTMTGALSINIAGSNASLALIRAAGFGADLYGQTGASMRWLMRLGDAAAETGANAGSNFVLYRGSDAGTLIDSPLSINRATALVTIAYNLSAANITTGNVTANFNGYKPGGGAWADSSDIRIKNVQGEYKRGLDDIAKLQPVIYTYKGNDTQDAPDATKTAPYPNSSHAQSAADERKFAGLIAQEVEAVLPEMVTLTNAYIDGVPVDDMRVLDTTPLIFALVNAVKELKARIEVLESV
jgi:hypothetical protein